MCTGSHPFIAGPKLAQVAIRAERDGQQIENVLWVNMHAAPDITNLTALAATVSTWYGAFYVGTLPDNVIGREVVATGWDSATGSRVVDPTINGAVGTMSGLPLPNEVSLALKLNTGTRGHSFSGRMFWLGLTTGQVTANRVNSAQLDAIVAAGANLITSINGAGFNLVVASFCHANVWRTSAVYTDVISMLATDDIVDGQSRRGPGRGR